MERAEENKHKAVLKEIMLNEELKKRIGAGNFSHQLPIIISAMMIKKVQNKASRLLEYLCQGW